MAATSIFTIPSRLFAAGNFVSTNFTVPLTVQTVTISFVILAVDLANVTKSFTIELWRQDPITLQFVFDSSIQWSGGILDPVLGILVQPFFSVTAGPLVGEVCQLRASLPQSVTTSITVTSN